MPRSKQWRALKRSLDTLRNTFLPSPFDPLGKYPRSAEVQSHARAFIVLTHAEIETFLEEWAREIAKTSEAIWNSRQRPTAPLTYLVATLQITVDIPHTLTGGAKDVPQKLTDELAKMFQTYYKSINENNGIKERNLLRLFGPLGVPASALAGTLIPNLDSFGSLRGEHAHKSAKAIKSMLDPETEYNKVLSIVQDLELLDDWLTKYKKRVR